MDRAEFKKKQQEYLKIKNIGALESHGWKNLRDNIPQNSGGDSESPFISKEINIIINNPACEHYSFNDIIVARVFISWKGETSIHLCSLGLSDDSWTIKDPDILVDVFWKEINAPELNYLGEA